MGPHRDLLLPVWLAALLLVPAPAAGGLFGAFDPLTTDSGILNKYDQPALRPYPAVGGVESFFAFSTRSTVVGYETSREIWLHANASRAGYGHTPAGIADSVCTPLLRDPTGVTSYIDPAWSPDGKYLAYVVTNRYVSRGAIYVQEYAVGDLVSSASAPVGSPVLVVDDADGSIDRYPAWSPDGSSLAFESDRSRVTFDIWTVAVFPTPGVPERETFDDSHAEQAPAWSPDGTRIAFTTNVLGPTEICLLDLTTPWPHTFTDAETGVAIVTSRHRPSWASDGRSLYFSTNAGKDPEQLQQVWRLDLDSQQSCAIFVDATAAWDPDVSRHGQTTPDGIPYNDILFTSMAASVATTGPNTWRGNFIQTCAAPLRMNVSFEPSTLQAGSSGPDVIATLSFPAGTKAAGYQCQSFNGPLEGVRMRANIVPSPTLLDEPALPDPNSAALPQFDDNTVGGDPRIDVCYRRGLVESLLVAAGITGQPVSLPIRAYSNNVGRPFLGAVTITLSTKGVPAVAPRAVAAAPNPFAATTTLWFHLPGPGTATVRVFDARGALVRTVAHQWYPGGEQGAAWDGRTDTGAGATSGVYYVEVQTAGGRWASGRILLLR